MHYFQFFKTMKTLRLKKLLTFSQVNSHLIIVTTDLKHRNSDQKRVYEIGQSRMDPMRARLLDHLKKSAI